MEAYYYFRQSKYNVNPRPHLVTIFDNVKRYHWQTFIVKINLFFSEQPHTIRDPDKRRT